MLRLEEIRSAKAGCTFRLCRWPSVLENSSPFHLFLQRVTEQLSSDYIKLIINQNLLL